MTSLIDDIVVVTIVHMQDGMSALHIASKQGHFDFVRVLISIVPSVDINLQDKVL